MLENPLKCDAEERMWIYCYCLHPHWWHLLGVPLSGQITGSQWPESDTSVRALADSPPLPRKNYLFGNMQKLGQDRINSHSVIELVIIHSHSTYFCSFIPIPSRTILHESINGLTQEWPTYDTPRAIWEVDNLDRATLHYPSPSMIARKDIENNYVAM